MTRTFLVRKSLRNLSSIRKFSRNNSEIISSKQRNVRNVRSSLNQIITAKCMMTDNNFHRYDQKKSLVINKSITVRNKAFVV